MVEDTVSALDMLADFKIQVSLSATPSRLLPFLCLGFVDGFLFVN